MSVAIKKWITPEEQLMALIPSKAAFESSMLHRKDFLFDTNLINSITNCFIERLPQLTYWYTALKRLDLLPDLVPALPENFYEIYFGDCPIKKKADGESYKLYDTHSLYLIPKMSLNDLEARLETYARNELHIQNKYENPLRFRYSHQPNIFGSIESDRWEWVLIPNEVLEESQNQIFSEQLDTLKTLNQKVIEDSKYVLASLKQIATFLFFHKVASGESLYEFVHPQNGNHSSYVRVQDTDINDDHLEVGGYSPSGLFVHRFYNDFRSRRVGLAILRKFS